jgi:uncharacterized LabA/DUF88 family protein
MTDVNIACQLLSDAFQDNFDVAILITGDSDLVPPIKHVHELFSKKRVVVAFPPNRHTNRLKDVSKGHFAIGKSKILDAQFPDEVTNKSGFKLNRPDSWS